MTHFVITKDNISTYMTKKIENEQERILVNTVDMLFNLPGLNNFNFVVNSNELTMSIQSTKTIINKYYKLIVDSFKYCELFTNIQLIDLTGYFYYDTLLILKLNKNLLDSDKFNNIITLCKLRQIK